MSNVLTYAWDFPANSSSKKKQKTQKQRKPQHVVLGSRAQVNVAANSGKREVEDAKMFVRCLLKKARMDRRRRKQETLSLPHNLVSWPMAEHLLKECITRGLFFVFLTKILTVQCTYCMDLSNLLLLLCLLLYICLFIYLFCECVLSLSKFYKKKRKEKKTTMKTACTTKVYTIHHRVSSALVLCFW